MSENPQEDNDLNGFDDGFDSELPGMPPPTNPAPGNRNFLVAAGILAGLFIIGLLAVGGYLLLGRNSAADRAARAAAIEATNVAISVSATETAVAVAQADEAKAAPPPQQTQVPTNTPVIVVATNTPRATSTTAPDPAFQTQTAGALLTLTPFAPTATALPTTGFADEVGLPGLFGLGLFLLVVVFITRRMRLAGE